MEYRYEEAKNGEQTLLINGLYVHSKYNPTEEARKIVRSKYKPHHLHLVYGYGCGYIVKELIEKFQFNEPILIIDPLVDDKKIVVNEREHSRVYLTNSNDDTSLMKSISNLISYDTRIVLLANPAYEKVFPEIYKSLLGIVLDVQNMEIINVNTINKFAKEWQVNYFMNLKNLATDSELQKLKKRYNCPVVIASGGPSLTKQLALLQKFREQLILICAGSTINTLLKYNIKPDYVVSIDGGIDNYEKHFKHLKIDDAELFYSVMSHYKVNSSFNGNKYPFIPAVKSDLSLKIKKRFNGMEVPIFIGGGSVAHYALSIAKFLTCGPIALIGQDLAYTDNKTHAEGNSGRVYVEDKGNLIEGPGYYGGQVKTTYTFKSMKVFFEQIQEHEVHESSVYNCTEGGMKIELFQQKSFENFLKENCKDKVVKFKVSVKENEFNEDNYIREEFQKYERLIKLLKRGKSIAAKEKGPLFKTETLLNLNKIDKQLNQTYTELELDTLMQPVILANEKKYLPKMDEKNYETFKRVKAYTQDLYGSCCEVIEDYVETLLKIIEEEKKEGK